MKKGLLYCAARDTDCMEMYKGHGTCTLTQCVLDDPDYLDKEEAKARRRNELMKKEIHRRQEEKAAAAKIRTQTKTSEALLQEEIDRKREQMERYYRKGWTRYGDKASRELAALEKRRERVI